MNRYRPSDRPASLGSLPASPRLVIDYGTVGTVAVLAWPDGRWSALLFDGQPVLPSAVYTGPDGHETGHQAWSRASDPAGTFTASPLRTGTTGEPAARKHAQTATAATLRRVTDEATRVAEGPVSDVRLVVPAGWGPRRRMWLRGAAAQAGLSEPTLVDAPVAAATLLPIMGVQVPEGATLLILDVGSGCEATTLRRTGNGFEKSSTLHDANAGGDAVDDLLLAHIDAPAVPGRIDQAPSMDLPSTEPGQRRWALLASVRAGKEALAHRPTATVGLPPPAPAAIITTDILQHTAKPAEQRAAALAQQAIDAADINTDDLYGVYCIGAATTPGLHDAITAKLGIVPVTVPDAATFAALGAAALSGPTTAKPPTPAVRPLAQVTAVIVPGAASLTLLIQFLLTTAAGDRSSAVNWGQLTIVAVFLILVCLAVSPYLGALTQQLLHAQAQTQPTQMAPDRKFRYGILLGVAIGLAASGIYAVLASLHIGLPLGSALRWTVLPAILIAAAAVIATMAITRPRPAASNAPLDLTSFPRFPAGAALLVAGGMMLIQYTLTTPRPLDLANYLNFGTRLGGLLIGIGIAFTLVKALVLRAVLAIPWGLLSAAIADRTTTGILATMFLVAVLCWIGSPLLSLLVVPSRPGSSRPDFARTSGS